MFKQLAFKSSNKLTFYIHTTKNDNETVFEDTHWPWREQLQFRDICVDFKILVLTLSFSFWTWLVITTVVLQTATISCCCFALWVFFCVSFFFSAPCIQHSLCIVCPLLCEEEVPACISLVSISTKGCLSRELEWLGEVGLTSLCCLFPNPSWQLLIYILKNWNNKKGHSKSISPNILGLLFCFNHNLVPF